MTESKEDGLRAALEWYAEQVAGCRKITSEGNTARHALDADGGKRARDALSAFPPPIADAMAGGVLVLGTPEYRDYINRRGHEPDRRASSPPVGRLARFNPMYNGIEDGFGTVTMVESAAGQWVRYSDVTSPPVGGSGEVAWMQLDGIPRDGTSVDLLLSSGREVSCAYWGEDIVGDEGWFAGENPALGEDENVIRWRPYRSPLSASRLAAPVPNGVPEGWVPTADVSIIPSDNNTYLRLVVQPQHGERAEYRVSVGAVDVLFHELAGMADVAASPVTPEGLSGGDPKWPAYVPQVIEYEEGGYAQLLLEDAAVIHAEEMTVTVLRRMSSPEREILGFQWEIPFKEHG